MKTKLRNKTLLLVVCLALVACGAWFTWAKQNRKSTPSPKEDFALQERVLKLGQGAERRFYALRETAKLAVEAGDYSKAQQYATELLALAPKYKKNWNYGNAIHDGHMVLGRVALTKGDKKGAIQQLLEAGKTPGSPQLDSFGPNMSLARDLVAKGETQAVITYLDECKIFWKDTRGHLGIWKSEIKEGEMPDFGASLRY